MKRIYLDSNIFIAALNPEPITKIAQDLLEQADKGDIVLLSSVISYGEVLNTGLSKYSSAEIFLDSAPISFFSVDKNIVLKAAELRQKKPSLKLPDALHLATAISHNCKYFISEDKKLLKVSGFYLESRTLNEYINKLEGIAANLNYVNSGKKFTREDMNER